MQDDTPQDPATLSAGPAPEPRPRPDGLGPSLLASLAVHAAVALFVAADSCSLGVTGEMDRDAMAERAFVVVPVDEDTFARLRRTDAAAPDPADATVPVPSLDATLATPRAATPPVGVRADDDHHPVEVEDDVEIEKAVENEVVIENDVQVEVESDVEVEDDVEVENDVEVEVEVEQEVEVEDDATVENDVQVEHDVVVEASRDVDRDRDTKADADTEHEIDPDRARDPAPPRDLALDAERRLEPQPPEPVEPPEPPPPPETLDDVAFRRFLEVDPTVASDEEVEDAEYIGARDARPEVATRAPVTADESGPTRAQSPATAVLPTMSRPEVRAGDPTAPRDEVTASPAAGQSEEAQASAGGPRGDSAGSGAPGTGGDGWEGGSAAPRSDPSPAADGSVASRGGAVPSPATSTVEEALPTDPGDAVLVDPLGTDRLGASEEPAAASQPLATVASAAGSSASPDDPSDGDGVALAERAGDGSDRGGSAGSGDERAGAEVPGRDGTGAAGDDDAARDPVADLRESLGWGDVDRDAMPASPGRAASVGSLGTEASSPQGVVLDDVEIGFTSWARVTDDALGRYTEQVYAIVRERWHERDLDEDSKALGIQGRVTLVFRVYRNGDVSQPELFRSSGHDVLDRLALSAVPDRLPRFPRELEDASVVQRITFTYRNPLIAGEGD